jgi:hypothetical protein
VEIGKVSMVHVARSILHLYVNLLSTYSYNCCILVASFVGDLDLIVLEMVSFLYGLVV